MMTQRKKSQTKSLNTGSRIALVTGGSSGIGQAVCERLARDGSFVYVGYSRHRANALQVVDAIKAQGGAATAVHVDVTKEASVKTVFKTIASQSKRLDILVNSAGIEADVPFLEMTAKDWDHVFNTNLRGTFLCSQYAARMMAKAKIGSIVNISSVHEKIPWGGYAHYCSSKAGVMMLMKTMALELAAFNIQVNNVAPGAIATPINDSWLHDQKLKKIVLEKIPAGRVGSSEEVAGAVAYLVSHEASYVTGTTLFIDGGMCLYASFLGQA